MFNRICKICNKEFKIYPCRLKRNKNEGQFCSRECQGKAFRGKSNPNYRGKDTWEMVTLSCKHCNKEFQKPRSITDYRANIRFCSKECRIQFNRGENSYTWKGVGGRHMDGYIYKSVPNHPFKNSGGYVAEHRLIMEAHLGRYLRKDEIVHHMNHIVDDNRIENLMLLNPSEHTKLHNSERKTNGLTEAD